MNESLTTSSLRSTFRFPFEIKEWILPFVIGIALIFAGMLIPIIPTIFVYGYFAGVMRMAIKDDELILPQWKNWGKLFSDGIRCFGVGLIYLGPGILVSTIGFMAYFLIILLSTALAPDPAYSDPTASGLYVLSTFAAMGVLFLSMSIGTLLLLAGAIPLPAALGNFIEHDKFGAAFHIREWTKILVKDKWGYLIAWLLILGMFSLVYIGFMLTYMTFVLCVFGYLLIFPVGFYIMLVSAALFGQSYRQGAMLSNLQDSTG